METGLERISRSTQRLNLLGTDSLNAYGVDVWRTSELTWLDQRGKPHRANLTLKISCDSPYMVESKSIKLYLVDFAMKEFASRLDIESEIKGVISDFLESEVHVNVSTDKSGFEFDETFISESHNLDYIPLRQPKLELNSSLLLPQRQEQRVSGSYHTHLFRCLCPITSQPDYATIVVKFSEALVSGESLLSYLVSFRTHQGYHESTVERIYVDLIDQCSPSQLMVIGSFARRGGIDICPIRSSQSQSFPEWRSPLS